MPLTPYIGEIQVLSFNFPPKGWALCNGQLLPINQNQALFSLLGTMYGGNGQTNFALPDLRGSIPISFGPNFILGQKGGEVTHTVTVSEMAMHPHLLQATPTAASTNVPGPSLVLAQSTASQLYSAAANATPMAPNATGPTGGSQPHENMQPYTTLSICIALQGVFPSRN